jgi:hypothetical protein
MNDTTESHPTRPPLRIGLLLDGYTLPKWLYNVVHDITTSEYARVALVVLNTAPAAGGSAPPTPGPLDRVRAWIRNREHLPFALYNRIDRAYFGRALRALDDPFEPCDAEPLLRGCPVISVTPRMTQFSDYFGDAAVDEIEAYDLDVALRFGFRILRGRALHIARHGVWSYHHADNTVNRGGPPGCWEVFEGQPATGAVLQVLSEDLDGGRVLSRTFASTAQMSVAVNRARYYWQTTPMVGRKLRDLYYGGPALLCDEGLTAPAWSAYSNRLYVAPRGAETWRGMRRVAGRYVRWKVHGMRYTEQWFLAYKLARPAPGVTDSDGGEVPDGTPFRFRTLVPPPDLCWADPFPVYADGRHYVFFEEYPVGGSHGRIRVIEIDAKGNPGQPVTVLDRDHHLSYPLVFRHEGTWYMMPESASIGAVQLYRATRFPHEWELDRTVLEAPSASDATIAEIDGRWWLFAATFVPGISEANELRLYHADSPLGPWTPHWRNPVKTDVRSTRPAGRVFRHGGQYYRPAQDGTPHYGSAIVVNRIERIDLDGYREEPVARIDPRWMPGLNGTHTLNAAGGLTVIDARWPRRR